MKSHYTPRDIISLVMFALMPFLSGEFYVLAYRAVGNMYHWTAPIIPVGLFLLSWIVMPRVKKGDK